MYPLKYANIDVSLIMLDAKSGVFNAKKSADDRLALIERIEIK